MPFPFLLYNILVAPPASLAPPGFAYKKEFLRKNGANDFFILLKGGDRNSTLYRCRATPVLGHTTNKIRYKCA
jgi:hypothetical protein